MSDVINDIMSDMIRSAKTPEGSAPSAIAKGIDRLYGEHPSHRAISTLEQIAFIITTQEAMTEEQHVQWEYVVKAKREMDWREGSRVWDGMSKESYEADPQKFERRVLEHALSMLKALIFSDGAGEARALYGSRTNFPQHMDDRYEEWVAQNGGGDS